jgi:hypothetical protein
MIGAAGQRQQERQRHGEHVAIEGRRGDRTARHARDVPKAPVPAALLCLALLGGSDWAAAAAAAKAKQERSVFLAVE